MGLIHGNGLSYYSTLIKLRKVVNRKFNLVPNNTEKTDEAML